MSKRDDFPASGTEGQMRTRAEAWNRGLFLPRRDSERGENEGLGQREIKALGDENTRLWGKDWWILEAINQRCRDAGHK